MACLLGAPGDSSTAASASDSSLALTPELGWAGPLNERFREWLATAAAAAAAVEICSQAEARHCLTAANAGNDVVLLPTASDGCLDDLAQSLACMHSADDQMQKSNEVL